MSSKTPISGLQEFVVRFNVGSMPRYDLVQVAGPCHDPTFYVKVTVGDECATGCGRTKKEAKHAAAKAMFDELTRLKPRASGFYQKESPSSCDGTNEPKIETENNSWSPHFTAEPQSKTPEPDSDVITGNPIGELQELCVSRYWPVPVYEMQFERGLPHRKLFTVSCRVANVEVIGTGKSKKLGKRAAANKMLLCIKNQTSLEVTAIRRPNGVCREEFPSPKRLTRDNSEDEQNSEQYGGGVVQAYEVASDSPRRRAANQAHHDVRPKGYVNVNQNLDIPWGLAKELPPAKPATALSGAGAVTEHEESSMFDELNKRGNFTVKSESPASDSTTGCQPSRGNVYRAIAPTRRYGRNIGKGISYTESLSSKMSRSGGFIDPNESDYIESGGAGYMTLAEMEKEIKSMEKYLSFTDALNEEPSKDSASFTEALSEEAEKELTFFAEALNEEPPKDSTSFTEALNEEAQKDSNENPTSSDQNTPKSDRVVTNETCDLKPSQRTPKNCQERWMYCLSTTYGSEDVDALEGGKWMIFAKNCYVDDIWSKLKASVGSGDIWQAKVSWLDPKKKSHAIMVFTLDYKDVDDVIRVLDILEETGVKLKTSEIYYKPNYMTSAGVYNGGKQKPWIYRSSDIRERAMTGNYDY